MWQYLLNCNKSYLSLSSNIRDKRNGNGRPIMANSTQQSLNEKSPEFDFAHQMRLIMQKD